jgi:LacI family transcriptional regulator
MSNTTIKILAKELNLSVATVSKALRDSYEISAETKRKVHALAEKLNYVPNPYASSLRKRESKTIAVVLPEVADSFFSQAINGIESVAQAQGFHVLIYLTHESLLREESILKEFQGGRVDGVLISVSGETNKSDHIRKLIDAGIPVVFFDRVCEDLEATRIVTNDFECGFEATHLLARQGCKRIAYLSASSSLSISNSRMQGYKKALSELGFKPTDTNILHCDDNMDRNFEAIKTVLRKKNRPDGLIASVEKFTTLIYLACKELNLSIPGDVKVISFTNLPTAPILNPSLTTITQPAFEMGKRAALAMFEGLSKKNSVMKSETIVIPSQLHKRNSSGPIGK